MRARRRGMGLLIGTGVIWGTIGIAAKLLADETTLDPAAVTWLRTLIAAPVCLALAWATMGKKILAANRPDLTLMAGLGVVLVVYQFCYLAAVERIGVSIATLVSLCVPPMIVAVVSVLFLGERLTGRALVALLGAVVGTTLLVGWGASGAGGDQEGAVAGIGFALVSAALIAAHVMVSRSLAGRQPPLRPLVIAFPVGAVVFAPVGLTGEITVDLPVQGWLLLVYLAVVPSVIAYWMLLRALRDVPASTASVVTLLEPLVAAVLAWIIFSERLGPVGWFGAALLLGAIGLLSTVPAGGHASALAPDVPSPSAARR